MNTIVVKKEYFQQIDSLVHKHAERFTYDGVQLALIEELGELATEVAIEKGWKSRQPSSDGVFGELIDVFICVVASYVFFTPLWCDKTIVSNLVMPISCYDLKKISQFLTNEDWCDYVFLPAEVFTRIGGTQEMFDQKMQEKLAKWESLFV